MLKLRINVEKERDSGKCVLNFDAYIFTQEECDKALKALTICREILPANEQEAAKVTE